MALPRRNSALRRRARMWVFAMGAWSLAAAGARAQSESPESLRRAADGAFRDAMLSPAFGGGAPVVATFLTQGGPAGRPAAPPVFPGVPPPAPVHENSEDAAYAALGTLGRPAFSIPLDPLLNAMWRAPVTFKAGDVAVHVFGDKSVDKHTWFVGLYQEGADAPMFFNAPDLLRYKLGFIPIFSGAADFSVGGAYYTMFIDGKAHDKLHPQERLQSRLVIQPRRSGEARTELPLDQIARAAYAAGRPLPLGGVEYRLLYSQDFVENGNGEFGGFIGGRSIALLFARGESFGGYHFFEKDIPADRVLVATPAAHNSDDDAKAAGTFTVGLRINPRRELEVYFPVPQTVAALAR